VARADRSQSVKRLPWYRDKATLRAAVDRHGSVAAAADAAGTPRATVQHWSKVFGIRSGHPKTPAALAGEQSAPQSGYTYIVGAADQSLVKIGRTGGEPRARMSAMQTGSPVPLVLLATLPHPRWEDVLHHHYAAHRRQGEWFELALDDVAAIMRWACQAAGLNGDWPSDDDALAAGWDVTSSAIESVFGARAVRSWLR
jgi:hypothetical protein